MTKKVRVLLIDYKIIIIDKKSRCVLLIDYKIIIIIIFKPLSQLCCGRLPDFCFSFPTFQSQILGLVAILQIYPYYFHPCLLWPNPSPWWAISLHRAFPQWPLLTCIGPVQPISSEFCLNLSLINGTPNCSRNGLFLILSRGLLEVAKSTLDRWIRH